MDTGVTARSGRALVAAALLVLSLAPARLAAQHAAPPLPPPSGNVVQVSTVAQLQAAVSALTSGTTIVIAPGTYRLTQRLRIRNNVRNVALRGATSNRADVVLLGSGMTTSGVNVVVDVENAGEVLIANLSIGQVLWHPIQLHGERGADRVHIYNVRLFDAGEQFLKSSVSSVYDGTDDVIVEYSLIEYTNIGPANGYTQGIDAHHVANWIVRYNVFRNIRVPPTAQYRQRPAVLFWNGSRDNVVHSNTFINCERGIIFGLGPQPPNAFSHVGGAIYNNFIYRTDPVNADSGISVWDSPGTRVYNNTVIQNGTYPVAIEYRFPGTTGVEIANNLTDGTIISRDGARAAVFSNYTAATPAMFVNAGAGNLHLVAGAAAAIDKGSPIPAVQTDWDGDPRGINGAWDLGADERAGTPSANRPPVARATATPTSGVAPVTVSFSGAASTDPDGDPLTYQWTFGDGKSAAGATVSNRYGLNGRYTATLTVTDPQGAASSASVVISVAIVAPTQLRGTVSGRRVTLDWSDNSGRETAFFVERAAVSGTFASVAQLPRNSETFSDGNLAVGTYRYRVRAFDEGTGMYSAYSNEVSVTVR